MTSEEMIARNRESICLFRAGWFYRAYGGHAVTLAKKCGVTLVHPANPCDQQSATIPAHQLDDYIRKLVVCGHHVHVCELTGPPSLVSGNQPIIGLFGHADEYLRGFGLIMAK